MGSCPYPGNICYVGQRFYNPMKLQKEAFNTYNYIFFSNDHENTNFFIVLFNSPVDFIVEPRVIMNEKFYWPMQLLTE